MDDQRFDSLTRTLATGTSRRQLLRGLTGGVLGGALAAVGLRGSAIAAPEPKVDICHYDADTGTYHRISVSGNALAAHEAHGDNTSIGCAEGYALNTDTCECEFVPLYFCPEGATVGQLCAEGNGECSVNIDAGGSGPLVCAYQLYQYTGQPVGCNFPCTAGTCADGLVCVMDGNCGNSQHCHALVNA